jgi:hypothetical protein
LERSAIALDPNTSLVNQINGIEVDSNSDLVNKKGAVVNATTDMNLQGDNTSVDDPDDNAGDADAGGDGSAFVYEPFIEYNGDEHGCEADMTLTTLTISQKSEKVIQDEDKVTITWKDYVWAYISSWLLV